MIFGLVLGLNYWSTVYASMARGREVGNGESPTPGLLSC